MSGLCKYKDALGKPGEGAHAWRIPLGFGPPKGVAGTDLIMTGAAALLLSQFAFKTLNPLVSFIIVFIILIVVGIAAHRAFCVDTALNQWLGVTDQSSDYPKGD